MQRIVRTDRPYTDFSASAQAQLAALQQHCPPRVVNLFASAQASPQGALEWWSELTGQPLAYAQLTEEQQTALLHKVEQSQQALRLIIEQLTANQPAAARLLQQLLKAPTSANLFSINEQPVFIDWPNLPSATAATPSPLRTNNTIAAVPASTPASPKSANKKYWPWLLLLLLLLALLLYGFWRYRLTSSHPTVTPTPPLLDTALPKEADLTPAPAPSVEAEPRAAIDPTPPALTLPETKEQPPAQAQAQAPAAKTPATPTQTAQPAPAVKKSSRPVKSGRVEHYACSKSSSIEPPDFVTVLDTSGSMRLNIQTSAEEEQWINQSGLLYEDNNRHPKRLHLLREPTRENVAKQAYSQMLDHLDPDILTRLITFNGCPQPVDHGLYGPSQRRQLKQRVASLTAYDGTPLAASLRAAAAKVDGVTKDAMIVMFVDGEDGCGENICAVAKRLAQQKPRLQINMVDLSGYGLSNCVAEATQGRVYNSQNIATLKQAFLQSTAEFSQQSCD